MNKRTRLPKHVASVIAYLETFGARVRDIVVSHCHRLSFDLLGRSFTLRVAHSSDASEALRFARIELNRQVTRAGLTLPALA